MSIARAHQGANAVSSTVKLGELAKGSGGFVRGAL